MIDYNKIANEIDVKLIISKDDEFVYLLYPNPPQNGNILFEEREGVLILWSNEYKEKSLRCIISTIEKYTDVNIVVPYIDTKEEYEVLQSLGYETTDFKVEDDETYCKEFGSLIKRR